MYLTDIKIRSAARRAVNVRDYIPVIVTNDVNAPKLTGSYGGYYTRGGTPVTYPSAYAKVGWSNLIYKKSTIAVKVPIQWAEECASKHFCKVVFAGKTIYVKKRNLRNTERILSKYEKHILAAPEDKKELLYAAAVSLVKVTFAEIPDGVTLPRYTKQILSLLGHTPVEVSEIMECKLTSEHAKEWAADSKFTTPIGFLKYKILNKISDILIISAVENRVYNSSVLYWFESVFNDPDRFSALTKERSIVGPHGEKLIYQYFSKIDELQPIDLVNGLKTSVHVAFENAARRTAEEKIKWLKANSNRLAPDPEWWPGDTANYKLLRSAAELVEEGERLDHCVAQYATYVKKKESVIVSLGTSTVEFDYNDIKILQHYGFGNSNPSVADKEIANNLLKIINEKKDSINVEKENIKAA